MSVPLVVHCSHFPLISLFLWNHNATAGLKMYLLYYVPAFQYVYQIKQHSFKNGCSLRLLFCFKYSVLYICLCMYVYEKYCALYMFQWNQSKSNINFIKIDFTKIKVPDLLAPLL